MLLRGHVLHTILPGLCNARNSRPRYYQLDGPRREPQDARAELDIRFIGDVSTVDAFGFIWLAVMPRAFFRDIVPW